MIHHLSVDNQGIKSNKCLFKCLVIVPRFKVFICLDKLWQLQSAICSNFVPPMTIINSEVTLPLGVFYNGIVCILKQ